jgi:hypothetical protein
VITLQQFRDEFTNHTRGWTWEVEGFLDAQGYVHPIDLDTKVISTVFERLSSPVIRSIAHAHGYIVETANQTTYPDFTLSRRIGDRLHRIAVDIKTTYFSPPMLFTLGGYNSFLLDGTKNILHPYSTYSEHWIVGFIYDQGTGFPEYTLENMPTRGHIPCPYSNVTFFIREKHAISGLRAGSGNTKNIGSIKLRDRRAFEQVNGPFMAFTRAKEACDKYWRNYDTYKATIFTQADLERHADFIEFR